MYQKIRIIFYFPVLIFPLFSFIIINKNYKIRLDIKEWNKQFNIKIGNAFVSFLYLIINFRDFRNLYYFRLKRTVKDKKISLFLRISLGIILVLSEFFLPKFKTLMINGDIGGGLVLIHAYYGILCPKKIGECCKIWHNVTLGFKDGEAPTICDNVRIYSGSTIFGGIKIGENSVISPNTLVVRNIRPNCVVITEPGYIVKEDGKFIFEKM